MCDCVHVCAYVCVCVCVDLVSICGGSSVGQVRCLRTVLYGHCGGICRDLHQPSPFASPARQMLVSQTAPGDGQLLLNLTVDILCIRALRQLQLQLTCILPPRECQGDTPVTSVDACQS
jgi:hypothetical protein